MLSNKRKLEKTNNIVNDAILFKERATRIKKIINNKQELKKEAIKLAARELERALQRKKERKEEQDKERKKQSRLEKLKNRFL